MNKYPDISRVTNSRRETRDSYNSMSKWYDWLSGSSERKFKAKAVELLSAGTGETILEIGSGTGDSLIDLARSVSPPGMVYGIDLSEGMIHVAKSKLVKAGITTNVNILCADAIHIPFGREFFDGILISFTLELFDNEEIPLVLNECWRVLKPSGRIGIVSLAKSKKDSLMGLIYEWAHRRFQRFVDCRPIHPQLMVRDANFIVKESKLMKMWGLPVEVLLAEKPCSEAID